uniref:Uncharacterized protein n=1 Tax=Arundo donax TaxID=35708 RepID=A0A0A9B1E3_ARUDO
MPGSGRRLNRSGDRRSHHRLHILTEENTSMDWAASPREPGVGEPKCKLPPIFGSDDITSVCTRKGKLFDASFDAEISNVSWYLYARPWQSLMST